MEVVTPSVSSQLPIARHRPEQSHIMLRLASTSCYVVITGTVVQLHIRMQNLCANDMILFGASLIAILRTRVVTARLSNWLTGKPNRQLMVAIPVRIIM